ncbi:MAG: DNA adenine methylase, partial [Kiritimatiellaeota bacterium]|nr:DNA adenine methylase [Kiritimatiellota bacterium]
MQTQIITYIGNKRALLPFIGRGVKEAQRRLQKDRLCSLDLFSGSGVVARYLKQYSSRLIANDLEDYSRVCNACYLTNASEVDEAELH